MGILSIPGGALTRDPSIQAAAEFAVNDHNRKNPYSLVELVRVEKAASQLLPSGGCTIYYLSLNIQRPNSSNSQWDNPPSFTTAVVCVPPTMEPSISTGFMDLTAYEMKGDDSDDADMDMVPLFVSHYSQKESRQVAAELCLRHHNAMNPGDFLHLENVVTSVCFGGNGTDLYHLTLQVSNGQRSQLVTTLAERSELWGDDEGFSCTPLVNLMDNPYPEWISVELIKYVGALGLQHYRLLLPEDESSPIIFFKNLECFRQLSKIAAQLGPQKTREQLLPFLGEDNAHVNPQVLSLMAQQFGSLIPYLGGVEHAHLLLPSLISLSSAAPHVLKSALKSFSQIALHTNDFDFSSLFVPFVFNMATSESHLCRASSCAFFGLAYVHATSEMKPELIKVYQKLSTDDIPSVRGSVASSLAEVTAAVVSLNETADCCYIKAEHIHRTLAGDDHKYVRLLAAKECTSLLRLWPDPKSFYDSILSFSMDPFLEVLVLTPSLLYEFCVEEAGIGHYSDTVELIVPVIANLLSQSTTSIREEVARELIRLCRFLGREASLRSILPFVKKMASDSSEYVRAVSAWLLMHLLSVCREGLSQEIIPIFIDLVKGGCVSALLNIITRLDHVWDQLNQDIALELRKLLIATINELVESSSEIAKLLIVVYSPMLASLFGIDKFRELCLQRVKDKDVLVGKAAKKSLEFFERNEKERYIWNATSLRFKVKIGPVDDLCFPQDMSQLIHFIYDAR